MEVTVKVQIELSEATQAFILGIMGGAIAAPAKVEKARVAEMPQAPAPEPEAAEPEGKSIFDMDEEELMQVSVTDLTAALKSKGIDPSKFEGKNTNAKLRKLVLNPPVEDDDDEPEVPTAPAGKAPAKKKALELSEVRSLMASKVNDYRSEIKAKLTELGATNVSTLDESDYEEFYTFLQEL